MLVKKALKLLYVQVLIGLVLGIAVGHFFPDFGASLKVLGDLFVRVVKMMIAPIVFCTIVTGITSLTDSRKIGRTLGKSLGLFYVLMGVWTRTAGASFQKIVDTQGSDITHLMNALGSLHSMYSLIYTLLVVVLIFGVIGIGLTIYQYFIAR